MDFYRELILDVVTIGTWSALWTSIGILDEDGGVAFREPVEFGEAFEMDRAPKGAPRIAAADVAHNSVAAPPYILHIREIGHTATVAPSLLVPLQASPLPAACPRPRRAAAVYHDSSQERLSRSPFKWHLDGAASIRSDPILPCDPPSLARPLPPLPLPPVPPVPPVVECVRDRRRTPLGHPSNVSPLVPASASLCLCRRRCR